jgi:lysozyme
MIKFIDVNHWEGKLDWIAIKNFGINFSYAKATEGLTFFDDTFDYNVVNMERNKVFWGAYHYYREGFDPIKQAQWFYSKASKTQLTPVLDVEGINNPDINSTNVLRCLQEIEKLFGRKPMIYTGFYFWRDRMKSPAWSIDYKLWIANYTSGTVPLIPAPWKTWTFWQFTDRGLIAGKPLDVNWFNGTIEEFTSLVKNYSVYLPIISNSLEDRITIVENNMARVLAKLGL